MNDKSLNKVSRIYVPFYIFFQANIIEYVFSPSLQDKTDIIKVLQKYAAMILKLELMLLKNGLFYSLITQNI